MTLHRRYIPRLTLALLAALLPAAGRGQDPAGAATISGRVRGEAGQPLPGASVFLEGLGLGALTREDGQYTLIVPAARVPRLLSAC